MNGHAACQPVRLAAGPIEVVVLPRIGARLHRLRVHGYDLLRTPADLRRHLIDPFFWGAFNMAPWCNREETRRIEVGQRIVDLEANFRDGSAIHGQLYDRPWQQADDGSFHVRGGEDGWPWAYEASLRVGVNSGALRLEHKLINRSSDRMPGGLGIHPWFRRPMLVAINAEAAYPSNTDARARPEPVAGALDLRRPAEMEPALDATWTGLSDPAVEIWWPDANLHAVIRAHSPTLHMVAANPPDLDATAVEPQTHAPHGLRRLLDGQAGGLTWVAPGAALTLTTEMLFEQAAAPREAAHHGRKGQP